MVCRLCLVTLNVENKISLFNGCDTDNETQIVKLIAKYFHFEVTQHDAISTTICPNCCTHLDEFNRFCTLVEEKQNTLRKEFLEVKCDVLLLDGEAETVHNEQLYAITDVLEEEPSEVLLKAEAEHNIFDEATLVHSNGNASSSSEDDIPLLQLKKKKSITTKSSKSKTNRKRKHNNNNNNMKTTHVKRIRNVKGNASRTAATTTTTISTDAAEAVAAADETNNQMSAATDNNATNNCIKLKTNKHKENPIKSETAENMDKFIVQHIELKCNLCDTKFQKFAEVRAHYNEQHINERAYINCCGVRHNKRRDLYDHIKWHLDPDYFKCNVCGKVMKNRYCLAMHTMTKHLKQEELIYDCEYCKKRFARPSLLTSHIKTTHEAKRSFVCEHCNKSFLLKHALKKHIKSIHDNIFPYICDVCGMKFKFKPSFETHVLEHQGIVAPPVKCPECGEWVKNQNRLRLHLTTHNKIDVHCQYCGRVCASLSARRAHIQYMHRRPPSYKCSFCSKCFKTPKMLKEHVATHTGENLYSCPHCAREFRSSANMYVHIKRLHTQQWLTTQMARSRGPPNVESN